MLASQGAPARIRILGPADLPEALALLERNPVTNVFAHYRTRLTSMDPRWLGGEMWGYVEDEQLVSMCHVGANLVPIEATEPACAAFADRARNRSRVSSTIVGPRQAVSWLWEDLRESWGGPREERWDQPHLIIDTASALPPDPLVRRTTTAELDDLYPACVAMYTEEVGISPEVDGGRQMYRARVSQLINRGWSFSRIEDGVVVFKAELACVSDHAAQVQGVYVDPSRRGEGLCARGMATVIDITLREIAPAVSLYVNGHNRAARAAYERVGFTQSDTFATIMF